MASPHFPWVYSDTLEKFSNSFTLGHFLHSLYARHLERPFFYSQLSLPTLHPKWIHFLPSYPQIGSWEEGKQEEREGASCGTLNNLLRNLHFKTITVESWDDVYMQ